GAGAGMKPTGLGLLIAMALVASAPDGWAAASKMPAEVITPAGFRQATAVYVPMPDGVEIAVNVLLPPDLKPGERVPVLMRTTRYWRAPRPRGGVHRVHTA